MTPRAEIRTRKAILPDVAAIHSLIVAYSREGTLLPRTLSELAENVRDFTVVERNGEIVGCGALHLYGPHLAEVRSIAVVKAAQGQGAGSKLIAALLEESQSHKVSQVCLFTRAPLFFGKLGFVEVPHAMLPDKIFKDCQLCPRFRNGCDEIAMVYGGVAAYDAEQEEVVERPVLINF
ncbi:MAG: N-acetyltransferase [Terriglobales bacterium]